MIKQVFLDLSESKSLGDTLCSTPVIRNLRHSYQKKINLITNFSELFVKNDNVQKIYTPNSLNIDFIKENHIYHNSFYNIGRKNEHGVEYKSNIIDIRQYHAILLGFMLTKNELHLDYTPEEFTPIKNLPEKYVLLHPVQNWPSRTWDAKKWMVLTSMLNESNISVVTIGKSDSEVGFFNIKKPVFNFKIKNGLNLMNKTTLSQAWHLIDKSLCFVTMDSGLLHLAGTTDSEIIQLGSSINPEFRAPYRNNSQEYKYHYLNGGCTIYCASDMKYGVNEWNTMQGVPPLIGCLEKKSTFECHPSPLMVYNKIMEIVENS